MKHYVALFFALVRLRLHGSDVPMLELFDLVPAILIVSVRPSDFASCSPVLVSLDSLNLVLVLMVLVLELLKLISLIPTNCSTKCTGLSLSQTPY